jgi:hypothetical protein
LPNNPQTQQQPQQNRNNNSKGGGRNDYQGRTNTRTYTTPGTGNTSDRRGSAGGSSTSTSRPNQQQQQQQQPRSYTTVNGRTGVNTGNSPRSYDSNTMQQQRFGNNNADTSNGLPPLKLVNPLRVVRIVEQTPGTNEEIYSSVQERGGGGGGRRDDNTGRGSRPLATAGGISKLFMKIVFANTIIC